MFHTTIVFLYKKNRIFSARHYCFLKKKKKKKKKLEFSLKSAHFSAPQKPIFRSKSFESTLKKRKNLEKAHKNPPKSHATAPRAAER
jgi:hypothetical protein